MLAHFPLGFYGVEQSPRRDSRLLLFPLYLGDFGNPGTDRTNLESDPAQEFGRTRPLYICAGSLSLDKPPAFEHNQLCCKPDNAGVCLPLVEQRAPATKAVRGHKKG